MCTPQAVGIGLGAIGGITTAAQVVSQNRQAAVDTQAAETAYNSDIRALLERSRQIDQQANLSSFERSRQALRERARITVAAGEANVGGRSLLRQISNSLFQESFDTGIMETNRQNQQAQNTLQAQGVAAQRQSRTNTANSRRINPFLGSLMIAGSAASGYFGAPRGGG